MPSAWWAGLGRMVDRVRACPEGYTHTRTHTYTTPTSPPCPPHRVSPLTPPPPACYATVPGYAFTS